MITSSPRNLVALFCSLMAASLIGGTVYCDENLHAAEPKLKSILTPNFDLGYLELSVKNLEKLPIKVATQLQDQVPPPHADPARIYVSVIFTKSPDVHPAYSKNEINSMITADSRNSAATEIAADENRVLKFQFPLFYIKLAKVASEAKVVLTFNGISLQTMSYTRTGDVWKLEN
jgi:hypothetical protein